MPSFVNATASATVGLLVGAAVFYGLSGVDTDNLAEDYPTTVAAPSEPASSRAVERRGDSRPVEPVESSEPASPVTTTGTAPTALDQVPIVDDAYPVAEPYTFTAPAALPGELNYRADRPRDTDRFTPDDYNGLAACTVGALADADPLNPGYVVNQLIRRCLAYLGNE